MLEERYGGRMVFTKGVAKRFALNETTDLRKVSVSDLLISSHTWMHIIPRNFVKEVKKGYVKDVVVVVNDKTFLNRICQA